MERSCPPATASCRGTARCHQALAAALGWDSARGARTTTRGSGPRTPRLGGSGPSCGPVRASPARCPVPPRPAASTNTPSTRRPWRPHIRSPAQARRERHRPPRRRTPAAWPHERVPGSLGRRARCRRERRCRGRDPWRPRTACPPRPASCRPAAPGSVQAACAHASWPPGTRCPDCSRGDWAAGHSGGLGVSTNRTRASRRAARADAMARDPNWVGAALRP